MKEGGSLIFGSYKAATQLNASPDNSLNKPEVLCMQDKTICLHLPEALLLPSGDLNTKGEMHGGQPSQ